jgi:drug/metabolite transporter (DMT)-like permease
MNTPSNPSSRRGFLDSHAAVYLSLIGANAIWGATLVLSRGVHEVMPPLGLGFWRWLMIPTMLLPFVWRDLRREASVILASWKTITMLGIFLVFGSTLAIVSVNYTTAINAGLVNAAQPTVTLFVGLLLFRDRVTWVQTLGLLAAFCGIVVMVTKADFGALLAFRFNGGDFWMLLAVFGYASYAVNLRRLSREIGLMTGLFAISLAGTLTLLPFYIGESIISRTLPLSWGSVGTVVFLGLVGSVLAMIMWNRGLMAVGANRAAIFVNLIPVFAALFAIPILGESLYLYHFAGAALVCAGIFLVVRGHRGRAHAPALKPAPEETS